MRPAVCGGLHMKNHRTVRGAAVLYALVVLFACVGCGGNPYLKGYQIRTPQEERELLAQRAPQEADRILAAKLALRDDPRDPATIRQLSAGYADIAEQIGNEKDPLFEYCTEAAGHELKMYKARGGTLTAEVIAETGRNLYLRKRQCTAKRWLGKALVMDPALAADYAGYLERSKAECGSGS